MYLIYGKNTVGKAVAKLCQLQKIDYVMADDSDNISDFSPFEAIIPSPGIPSTHRIYQSGKIIAELDFAFQFLPKNFQIVTITGTDGKSTTTWILYSILQKYFFDKKKVFLSGNFEIPFSETVAEILTSGKKEGIIVLEISSFMSYFIGKSVLPPFSPDFTIFTNLKTDHLNWHADLQEYFDAKMNLVRHTKQKSILNDEIFDFARAQNLHFSKNFPAKFFSEKNRENFSDGENIFLNAEKIFSLSETLFSGKHNAFNILSVLLVLAEMNLDFEKIFSILREIRGLPHRLEDLGKMWKVRVIEDSKSTSAQSLEAALGSYGNEKNILLIVGGSDKWDSFDHLADLFEKRVKKLACIGATKGKFSQMAREKSIEFLETDNLNEATKWLYNRADEGDILMLSPGCASFGLFADYLDRANKFRESLKYISEK